MLPREHAAMHDLVVWLLPLHDDPPFSAGVATVRVLILMPCPQATLQFDQLDHESHAQLTAIYKQLVATRLMEEIKNFNLCMQICLSPFQF